MSPSLHMQRTQSLVMAGALALSMLLAGFAHAATPAANEAELLQFGFKPLVATTKPQEEFVRNLAPGQIRPLQRNGKKFFIYPDAPNNRVFVGGPQEYEAYLAVHPQTSKPGESEAATRAYRMKQDDTMRKATARDLSDPFLGASWADFGW